MDGPVNTANDTSMCWLHEVQRVAMDGQEWVIVDVSGFGDVVLRAISTGRIIQCKAAHLREMKMAVNKNGLPRLSDVKFGKAATRLLSTYLETLAEIDTELAALRGRLDASIEAEDVISIEFNQRHFVELLRRKKLLLVLGEDAKKENEG